MLVLVLGVHGAADVHGGEDREDEGLQERDEDLEAGEGDEQGERDRQDDAAMRSSVAQRGGEHGEGDQQQVAGEHVGEEPDGERQRPRRRSCDELDRRDQDVSAFGTPGGNSDVLEVAERSPAS